MLALHVDLRTHFGLSAPIMLAPMAGGPGSARLATAVSAAGGLGSVGSAYFTPAQILEAAQEVRRHTARPFALSLFAPQAINPLSEGQLQVALNELSPIHHVLGLDAPRLPSHIQEDYRAQFEAVLEAQPAAVVFTFGLLDADDLNRLHHAGIVSIGSACSVSEARQLAASGVSAVVVQGLDAGGHRASWQEDSRRPTLELLRAVRQVVDLPLLAAGGLMKRQDVQAVLDAGAELAVCGTAFLCAHEAGTSAPYREALLRGGPTALTRAFSGRWARGLHNVAMEQLAHPLPTPQQNALTRAMRAAATAQGRAEYLSLWAGTGVAQVQSAPATTILAQLSP